MTELPPLEGVNFPKERTFNFQDHDWLQHGRELICVTCPTNSRHGTRLPVGLMLMGARGHWQLVTEGGIPRQRKRGRPRQV